MARTRGRASTSFAGTTASQSPATTIWLPLANWAQRPSTTTRPPRSTGPPGSSARSRRATCGSLPLKTEVDNFTLAHGSPRDPVWEYVVTPWSAAANFRYFRTDRCLVGHSHIPFICRPSDDSAVFGPFPLDEAVPLDAGRAIVNPGGLGQPRDGDPRTTYAVYDADAGAVYHHRVEYDIRKTQEKIVERGLPLFLALRLAEGR